MQTKQCKYQHIQIYTQIQDFRWKRGCLLPTDSLSHDLIHHKNWNNIAMAKVEYKPVWTRNRYPIAHPGGWAMGCLLRVFWQKLAVLKQDPTETSRSSSNERYTFIIKEYIFLRHFTAQLLILVFKFLMKLVNANYTCHSHNLKSPIFSQVHSLFSAGQHCWLFPTKSIHSLDQYWLPPWPISVWLAHKALFWTTPCLDLSELPHRCSPDSKVLWLHSEEISWPHFFDIEKPQTWQWYLMGKLSV